MADPPAVPPKGFEHLYAPWWAYVLGSALPIGLFTGIWYGVKGGPMDGLVLGSVAALIGALGGAITARFHRRARAAVDRIPDGQHQEVRRAALSGPVPADPVVREAALGLATFQLATLLRARPFFLAGIALGVVGAVIGGSGVALMLWAGIGVAVFTAAAFLVQWVRLRRRIAALRSAGHDPGARAH